MEDFIERTLRERRSLEAALADILTKHARIPSGQERILLEKMISVLTHEMSYGRTHAGTATMSQFDELAVPTNIPDELWQDINRVRTALVTFAYYGQMSVEAKELRTGEYDLEFYRWLEPLVDTANQMRNIKRYAPATAEIILFPRKAGEAR